MVGVGSSQFAQVANWSSANLTVHVHLLHLVLWAHEHLQTVESMHSNQKGEKQTGNELSFKSFGQLIISWNSPEIEPMSAFAYTDKSSSAFREERC